MKVIGAITRVERPVNGHNFGKLSIEHLSISYPKRLDALVPEAGEVEAIVSSKWMDGKNERKWVALNCDSIKVI